MRYRKNLFHDIEQYVESRLDGIATIDRNVTVQDLLQDLGIAYESLPRALIALSTRRWASILCGCGAPMRYIGMLESTRITSEYRRTPSQSRENLVDVAGRKFMPNRGTNGIKLPGHATGRFLADRVQSLADPFRQGHVPRTRDPLDLMQDYLQPLSHAMSVFDSMVNYMSCGSYPRATANENAAHTAAALDPPLTCRLLPFDRRSKLATTGARRAFA